MLKTIARKLPFPSATLYKFGVLGGLIIAEMGLGFIAPRVSPEILLIAVAAPPTIMLALNQIEYGVLAIILTAAFVRASLPTGTQSRIVASLVVTAVFIVIWLARMLAVGKKLRLRPAKTNIPLIGLILTIIISYVWSNAFRDPLVMVWASWPFIQLGALAVMILLPGAFLLTANCISEIKWLKILCWTMILIGTISIAAYFADIPLPSVNTRGLFSLWLVSLAYAQALFNKDLPPWLRLGLLGLAAAWVYRVFILGVTWLSGWIPPLVAIATISFLRSKKAFLIFLLVAVAYVGLNWDYYVGPVLTAEAEESGYSCLDAWAHNWQVTSKHFLFGVGPAGYAAYYMSYFPSEAMATRSQYIDILSQTGIVGLFFSLWFFGALAWMGYKLCRRLKNRLDFSEGFASAALAGCGGCIVAMGFGDWLFPFVYTQTIAGFDYAVYNWILLGGMVALASICEEQSQ